MAVESARRQEKKDNRQNPSKGDFLWSQLRIFFSISVGGEGSYCVGDKMNYQRAYRNTLPQGKIRTVPYNVEHKL